MKSTIIVLIAVLLAGCAGRQIGDDARTSFTYSYSVSGVSEQELWNRARNHFAMGFNDLNSVFPVQDMENAVLIGRGRVSWSSMFSTCSTGYHILFQSRDNQARLELSLIESAPPGCNGMTLPNDKAYPRIVNSLNAISSGLEQALMQGSPFTDF